ncbi:hypothetical protein SAMN02910429_00013 [Lachnobacterium bovis]|uniref:Mannosyl-glycoprotein endo-beta-N-acetylglucosamidase-like domain-containing protein n=1 Tax=Lachnobacterium bovis TaxID=140626 RepID=A0A1H9NZL9_9FIRM|nr:hypothetical protein SAMN02910429_00013 [Lachnobacterium bovis]
MKNFKRKLFSILLVFTCLISTVFMSGSVESVKANLSDHLYPIMGSPSVTVNQMINYYEKHAKYPSDYQNSDAPTIYHFCKIYMEECEAEGVKTEVAFAQAMNETGFLKYGGDVHRSQYNFAGIGAVGGGAQGNSFRSVREGVRAQVQHLKAYASIQKLRNPVVDPRYKYVYSDTSPKAPYVQWLGIQENPNRQGWAAAKNYGYTLVDRYIAELLGVSTFSTWYAGVNYAPVYDPGYYKIHNPDAARAYGSNSDSLIRHFINNGMSEGRIANPNFDVKSYMNRYKDLRNEFGNDLKRYYMHYIMNGQKEGRNALNCPTRQGGGVTKYAGKDYSLVYNYEYYIQNNPDVKNAFKDDDIAILRHFINNGMKEGRKSSPNFDWLSYRNAYADLRVNFKNDKQRYYLHYISNGKKEGRKATGVTTLLNPITKYAGKDYSAVYNYNYYIEHNKDVAAAFPNDDVATLKHFVEFGMKEGRQAAENFNFQSYKYEYKDLREAFGHDKERYYLHYISNGQREGRQATGVTSIRDGVTSLNGVDYSLIYNYIHYIENNSDVAASYPNDDEAVLKHFVEYGMREGRNSIEGFNVQAYKENNVDLKVAFGDDLAKYYEHYMRIGHTENRIHN